MSLNFGHENIMLTKDIMSINDMEGHDVNMMLLVERIKISCEVIPMSINNVDMTAICGHNVDMEQ